MLNLEHQIFYSNQKHDAQLAKELLHSFIHHSPHTSLCHILVTAWPFFPGRYKHWTALLDWNTGMDYCTDIFLVFIHFLVSLIELHLLRCTQGTHSSSLNDWNTWNKQWNKLKRLLCTCMQIQMWYLGSKHTHILLYLITSMIILT